MASSPDSPWADPEVLAFRKSVRAFVQRELVPRQPQWREKRQADAEVWPLAGALGMLLPDVPAELGGGGGTFVHQAVVLEELAAAGVHFSASIQSIVAHYLLDHGTAEQKGRFLPGIASGALPCAIAMTEPDAGSDLGAIRTSAIRDGDAYRVNGSKTFITNATQARLVCLAVRTDPAAVGTRGLSLLLVETRDLAGYRVGRPIEKVGRHGQDTCELFFEDARVPAANLLGGSEGRGFAQLMQQLPYERLSVAVAALATAEAAVLLATQHAKERIVAGAPLIDLQTVRFALAECATEVRVGRAFVESCVAARLRGKLDAATAAMAKWWMTEREFAIVDRCLQLFGGYGYSTEFPIARLWADCRIERIYAGANEVLKELIGWSI